jgi:hypothetical protein
VSTGEAITTSGAIEEARANVSSNLPENTFREDFSAESMNHEFDFTHLQGLESHYQHKGYWSIFLMSCIGVMIVFQSVLLTLVGFHVMDFSQYEWLLPALLVQNLAQVVGLATFAVKALFDKRTRRDDAV